MDKQKFQILGVLLTFLVVSESGVIVPRDTSKQVSAGDAGILKGAVEPAKKEKEMGLNPEVRDDDIDSFDTKINEPSDHVASDNSNERDNNKSGAKPEKDYGRDEISDDGFYEPFDGEENFDKSVGGDKDLDMPVHEDDDESIHDYGDESVHEDADEFHHDEDYEPVHEHGDESIHDHVDEPHYHDDEHDSHYDDDEHDNVGHHVPIDEDYRDYEEGKRIPGFLGGGSIFDNPFFNFEQVQKYFHKLEKALGQVFRQTLEEALLLNGTYANTTEEEVDIHGKKFIVQKSLIKGRDNHSSIYIETLSSKPKRRRTQVIKD